MSSAVTEAERLLPEAEWRPLEEAHQVRVDAVIGPHLERARRGIKHPVIDFLFTYYSQSPSKLRRWHPGWRTGLLVGPDHERFSWKHVRRRETAAGVVAEVDITAFLTTAGRRLRDIRTLLTATAGRPPQFGCFGLHEWAMVYRQSPEQLRHAAWPLRLSPAETDRVVEQGGLRCTHFDAYRFFTPPAAPLNPTRLTRDAAVVNEQPGCLHATMDLYKCAFLLTPVVSSDVVWEAFSLAMDVRALDMQAAPYDLRALGYDPVAIETVAGRAEYARRQKIFAHRGQELRARLLTELSTLP